MLALLKTRKSSPTSEQLYFKRRTEYYMHDILARATQGADTNGGIGKAKDASNGNEVDNMHGQYLLPLLERLYVILRAGSKGRRI